MKKVSLFLTVMLLSLSLMGCNFNKDKNNNATNDAATDNADTNVDQGTNDNANNNNGETKLEVAKDAADRITELEGVESATVIVTDQNAYAAVVLEGDNTVNNTDNTDNTDNNGNTDGKAAGTDTNNVNNHNSPDQVLSSDLENKIAEKVREANENIRNVYVSLNPDFVERMTGYQERINRGEPVEGFFDEFSEAVQRVFPDHIKK
jgi:spore cortex protein